MKRRILSGIIAVLYLLIAYYSGGSGGAVKCAAYLVLPLACIWYSEAMGNYDGILMQGGPMTQTPGCLVAMGGWFLLLLPAIVAAYWTLKETH